MNYSDSDDIYQYGFDAGYKEGAIVSKMEKQAEYDNGHEAGYKQGYNNALHDFRMSLEFTLNRMEKENG